MPAASAQSSANPNFQPHAFSVGVLSHLLAQDLDFTDLGDVDVGALLGAQAATAGVFLEPAVVQGRDAGDDAVQDILGASPGPPGTGTGPIPDITGDDPLWNRMQEEQVHAAFTAVTNATTAPADQRDAILALRVPEAVKHLAGMLSHYDWAFVEQAQQIRSYVVAKLLEETKSNDPRIRLRALELTGKLTEVGSFTERVEITRHNGDSKEILEKIQGRLAALMKPPALLTPSPEPEDDISDDISDAVITVSPPAPKAQATRLRVPTPAPDLRTSKEN